MKVAQPCPTLGGLMDYTVSFPGSSDSKSLQMVIAAMKLKDAYSLEGMS